MNMALERLTGSAEDVGSMSVGKVSSIDKVLEVRNLRVSFPQGRHSRIDVVRNVSLDVRQGEAVGLVGESGSGKTVTAMTLLGLVGPPGGKVQSDGMFLDRRRVDGLGERQWRRLRGSTIAMIFQQPTRSLNPAYTVGQQLGEHLRRHTELTRSGARRRSIELLERVEIAHASRRIDDYPHQLSGGMCQRVMIAMAIAGEPRLIIADEPTSALDVTVQTKIVDLLKEIQAGTDVSILFISHDLGVVADLCERAYVMYAGEIVEEAHRDRIFSAPTHPYTAGLLAALPQPGRSRRLIPINGQPPPPRDLPPGCAFHPRCPYTEIGTCDATAPALTEIEAGQSTRCLLHSKLDLEGVK